MERIEQVLRRLKLDPQSVREARQGLAQNEGGPACMGEMADPPVKRAAAGSYAPIARSPGGTRPRKLELVWTNPEVHYAASGVR